MSVSAERITVAADRSLFDGAGRLRFPRFEKLARMLGFGSPRPPHRPAIRHALERLTLHNGAICEIHRGQPGRPYLFPGGVEVVRKLSFRELNHRQCEYRFELNGPTDLVWRCFIRTLLPGFPVRIDGKVMALLCSPAELESSYEQVKEAMAWANAWHAEEWEELIAKVSARDEELRAAREMEENRRTGLQRQFDYLPL